MKRDLPEPTPRRPEARPVARLTSLAALVCGALAAGAGCEAELDPVAELVAALPDESVFAIDLPGEPELEGPGRVEAPLLGRPAGMRELVRGVRRFLGQSLGGVLLHIERVTATSPASESAERVVWRVRAPGGQLEYGVVLRRVGEGRVTLSAWLRPARLGQERPPWRFLMAAQMTRATSSGATRGTLWIDLDHDLDPRSRGVMVASWAHEGGSRLLEVAVIDATPDEEELGRLTRTFRYTSDREGGSLVFDAGELNVHLVADKPLPERVRVAVRWNAAQRYRADYAAIGPEVHRDGFRALVGGECWGLPGGLVEYEQRLGLFADGRPPRTLWEAGDRASCPFPAQEAPLVPPPGPPPAPPAPPDELDGPDF